MTDQNSVKKQKVGKVNNRWLASVQHLPPHEAFEFVKNCNCCDDHKIDRPQEYVIWEDYYNGKQVNFTFRSKPCVCDCRCLARQLCRGIDLSQCKPIESTGPWSKYIE